MKLDSIIFDLDGTLWDSTRSVVEAWNDTLENYDEVRSKLTIEDMGSIMGLVIKDVSLKLFPYLEAENGLEIVKECCVNECAHLEKYGATLYENLEKVLNVLNQRYQLFIVSNCQSGYIESFFKSHQLEKYFKDYESAGGTGLTKGENIKLIMNRNNLVNSIYVGDTLGDKEAADYAGIPFVYAKYGFGEVEGCEYVMDRFEDILQFVQFTGIE
ncbi:MAG: HAD family hydrolase [Clostridiales bacterium]|nr:HAD family hydrolase [Clostridiales bacterium]